MLAFSNDYYGFIFRVTQSVELFCTYQKIMKQLIISYPNTTMIFGLHQKELFSFMDEIYIFDHGHILDHGTYDELCEKSSVFGGIIK